jgi:hypothetical protein
MNAPLTNEQLKQFAPSIFATEPWNKVSSRYAFVPTSVVLDELRKEGFVPVKVSQSNTRIEGKQEFTKHMIRLRHQDYLDKPKTVGDEIPELVLVNSHDRSSSYQLSAGVFRLVCSNGMVVRSANFGDISVHHTGDIVGEVIEGSAKIIKEMPQIMEHIKEFRSIKLSTTEQLIFANAAMQLRYPTDEDSIVAAPINAAQLLSVRRAADNSNDLWTTFNRVQENFIKGGLRGKGSTGKRMTTRKIASVTEDLRLNKALWLLTEEMARLS